MAKARWQQLSALAKLCLCISVLLITLCTCFFMEQKKFKKLYIYLPRQPLVNDRPWLIAGILLVFIILLLVVYFYLDAAEPSQTKEVVSHVFVDVEPAQAHGPPPVIATGFDLNDPLSSSKELAKSSAHQVS